MSGIKSTRKPDAIAVMVNNRNDCSTNQDSSSAALCSPAMSVCLKTMLKRTHSQSPIESRRSQCGMGSADNVVEAMNDFNGKCRFSGSDSSWTLWRIFKKFCTVDYLRNPTPRANVGVNRFKGSVSAHAWSCRRQASIFLSFFRSQPSHAHRCRSARWTDQRR